MKTGLVLVGAGPGDPDLLTLKGMKAIQRAEVVIYDALVSKDILSYASDSCMLIYAGKRAGTHSIAQSAINSLILKYAKTNLVVRLKGGDPFVFGRGYEEILIAHEHGIATEVIPGVTSAIAGPASAGIPVTSRNVSRSFWVVTGTTSEDKLNRDLMLACKSSATIIVLMGTRKLNSIAGMVRKFRGDLEPMAIIQNATHHYQHVSIGNPMDINEQYQDQKSIGPGIIVIGRVIKESTNCLELMKHVKKSIAAA